MGKYEKLLQYVLSGQKDGNINFIELCNLMEKLGFKLERISGSHHIFSYKNIIELIDLQPDKKDHSKAKIYQVKQVRKFLIKYLEV
jgi:predicted RNA binding protein YcfA (HicA-like mRNA interferase family)